MADGVLYCPICRAKTWHVNGVCEWSDGHIGAEQVNEARRYVEVFRHHTFAGTKWVDTGMRRIELDNMTDADALFVAAEIKRIETEAARRATKHAREGASRRTVQ